MLARQLRFRSAHFLQDTGGLVQNRKNFKRRANNSYPANMLVISKTGQTFSWSGDFYEDLCAITPPSEMLVIFLTIWLNVYKHVS